jgi:Rrf2 family protein
MPTVSKVLKVLLRGKLVVSVRGVSGGYLLSWPLEQITLADVITAVDGPIGMTQCSTTPGVCVQETGCAIRGNWQTLSRVIYEVLRQVTLADMSRPALRAVDIRAISARPGKMVGRRSGLGPATRTGTEGDRA